MAPPMSELTDFRMEGPAFCYTFVEDTAPSMTLPMFGSTDFFIERQLWVWWWSIQSRSLIGVIGVGPWHPLVSAGCWLLLCISNTRYSNINRSCFCVNISCHMNICSLHLTAGKQHSRELYTYLIIHSVDNSEIYLKQRVTTSICSVVLLRFAAWTSL